MAFPKIGNLAPAFTLLNQDGEKVSLKSFRGQSNVVVYFYPKASTPGCTVQACGLRDSKKELAKLDTVAIGISPDPVKRLVNFIDKQGLNFDLLSDEDHAVADKYGAWGPKKFMGREFDGIHRITFLINEEGIVERVIDKVKSKEHAAQILG